MAAARKAASKKDDESIPALGRDLVTLVIQYVKQETLDPIRGLGRYVAFALGAVLVGGLGLILLELGLIRLLQTETGSAFRGHLSFMPYLCALVMSVVVIAIALKSTKSGPPKDEV